MRLACGTVAGFVAGCAAAPALRTFFSPPRGGVGAVTVLHYPKAFDYAALIVIVVATALGGWIANGSRKRAEILAAPRSFVSGPSTALLLLVVTLLSWLVHYNPYALMDSFHEGEHLTPAAVFIDGGRPYRDIFVLHGLATDGGLDTVAFAQQPSPRRARILESALDALAIGMMGAVSAAACESLWATSAAVLLGFGAIAAGLLKTFPYFRLLPLLVCCFLLLVHVRTRRFFPLAYAVAGIGIVWSLDTGVYTVAVVVFWAALSLYEKRITWREAAISLALTLAVPLAILLTCRADLGLFFRDSFVIIPSAIDAIWSLPVPSPRSALSTFTLSALERSALSESSRYYLALFLIGVGLAMAAAHWGTPRGRTLLLLSLFSLALFRTAAGRYGWGHTRFASVLLGVLVILAVIEPMWQTRSSPTRAFAMALLVAAAVHFEVPANLAGASSVLRQLRVRLRHDGLVPYPLPRMRGMYTYSQDAADLRALHALIEARVPPAGRILDVSNQRALYYLMKRHPAIRCPDIALLSNPELGAEAMVELQRTPPSLVIISGTDAIRTFDGIPNEIRAPALYRWINEHYPKRVHAGRFVVALSLDLKSR